MLSIWRKTWPFRTFFLSSSLAFEKSSSPFPSSQTLFLQGTRGATTSSFEITSKRRARFQKLRCRELPHQTASRLLNLLKSNSSFSILICFPNEDLGGGSMRKIGSDGQGTLMLWSTRNVAARCRPCSFDCVERCWGVLSVWYSSNAFLTSGWWFLPGAEARVFA